MQRFIKVKFISLLFLFSILQVHAQNFEYLKTFGTKDGFEEIVAVADEGNGNVCVLFRERNYINTSIIFDIDTFKFNVPPGLRGRRTYIARLDSLGNILSAKYIGNLDVSFQNLVIDEKHDMYFSSNFIDSNNSWTSVVLDTKTYYKSDGLQINIKLDSNFNFLWVNQIGGDSYCRSVNLFSYKNKVFFLSAAKGTSKFGDSIYYLNNSYESSVFGELNSNDGAVIWSKLFHENTNSSIGFKLNGLYRINNNLYVYGSNLNTNKTINSKVFNYPEGFIIKTDSIGQLVDRVNVFNKNFVSIETLSSDGNDLYIGGTYSDTITFGNKLIPPEYPTGSGKKEFFIASITTSLSPRWFYRPQILNRSSISSGQIWTSAFNSGFLYFGAKLFTKISIGPDVLEPRSDLFSEFILFKTDLMGNVLWSKKGNSDASMLDMKPSKKAIFGVGWFQNGITLGTFSDSSKGYNDAFIVKLSDNAIIRGEVNKGPYCAGDTFKVPYTKVGDYDTSNVFIAELSDENGDFIGGQRELGRLKSNKDSLIIGKLPLFKVSSSEQYRIRIRSTAPAVQSYYKVDTLRLLIYSRDKANPGGDTTICKGDTLILRTYGGTKWTWSPKYKMKDSTSRETLAWPDKTTVYQIIISDSSGCGETDTATKTVFVRKDLSLKFHTPIDTTVCLGGQMPLIASFYGGDSLNYTLQWVSIDGNGNYGFPRTVKNKLADTFLFTMPLSEKDSMRFVLYLNDGCTPKNIFYTYTLKVKKTKSITSFNNKDTALCPGTSTSIVANFKGSPAELLNWKWQEKNQFNQWLQKQTGSKKQSDTLNYTLPLNWKGVKQIRTILTDNCSGLNDTAIYNITPRDTLKLNLNTGDTTLCKGQAYTYKATGKDGYAAGYIFSWIDTNTGDTLSKVDSLLLTANSTQQIKVTLTDGCMPNSISKTISIQVHPALQASMNINDTSLCFGQSLDVQASASGGKGTGYTYKWILDNTSMGANDTLQFKSGNYFTNAGTKTLYLVLNDGCTKPADTSKINISVLAPLKVVTNKQDSVCFGNSFSIKANATGGKGVYFYQWLDGNNVLQGNADSIVLSNKSNTQTQITRKIIVSDGCSKNDTFTVQTFFLAPLKLTVSTSDSCPTSTTLLTAKTSGGKTGQHQITWFNGSSQIGTGASTTVNPNGITQTYTAILKDNCSKVNDTASIKIGSKPSVKLLVDGQCLGDETSILAKKINTSNALNYAWEIDNKQAPETDSVIKRTFPNLGTYKVKVSVSAGATCKGADSTNLTIIAKPIAAFQYVHFQSIGNSIPFKFINQSQNSTNWLWTFGNGDTSQRRSPDYTYNDTGRTTVILIASNQDKCFDTTQQTLPIYDKIEFYFPNVFSPNGNNTNEGFGLHPGQAQFVKEFNLQVFNRWGELVYKSTDPSQQWSSTKYQQGVYIWKAEIRDVYNVLHELEGVVEVLK